jgi:16S rRNA (guanine527-N7)-methyltransferase
MPLTKEDREKISAWSGNACIMLTDGTMGRIEKYHDLIISWSERMNLVSRSDLSVIIENHFLDSLGPLSEISDSCDLLDIGSGAGFPAIPLAIFRPSVKFTLLESVHKKALFLRAVIKDIEIKNAQIVEGRLEEFRPTGAYDIVTLRALPRWEKMMTHIRRLLRPNSKIIYYQKRGVYQFFWNGQYNFRECNR